MTRLDLKILRRAARQIERAQAWWLQHRVAAPTALEDDLRRALELIREQPRIGARCQNVRVGEGRRVLLPRVGYHLYFRLSRDGSAVEVLAFWHASRGGAPRV